MVSSRTKQSVDEGLVMFCIKLNYTKKFEVTMVMSPLTFP